MNFPLLTTKLYLPPRQPRLVSRERLLRVLDDGLEAGRRVTLISAPAGFGKTTLLADWLAGRPGGRAAWLSLDADDNDLAHFLVYLASACAALDEAACRGALSLLQADQPPPPPVILAALINGLAELPEAAVLVLDDMHVIEADAPYGVLAYLMDHLPPRLNLVLVGRVNPGERGSLPVARLRARGQLAELRAADLRFTPEETADFLNQVMGLGLAAADVAALEARTEGWIAGLHLAALSLKSSDDPHAFLAAFTGSDRYVLDYLAEEVLRSQPAHVQSFLLQTALLERLCGPLCDAMLLDEKDLGAGGSQAILAYLEAANLFVVPLDSERCWYRYHTLFAEFLRSRLERLATAPGAHAAGIDAWRTHLHKRAARWFHANGFTPEALRHAFAAGDFEQAANWVEQTDRLALMPGDVSMLLGWLRALPEALVRSRARLSLLYAWALLTAGQVEAVERRVQDALAAAPDDLQLQGEAACLRAILANLPGDAARAITLAQEALAVLPDGDVFLRALAALNLGLAYDNLGDLDASMRAYHRVLAAAAGGDFPLITVMTFVQLADIHALQGRLGEAAALYRQAIEQAGRAGKPLNVVSMAHANLGWLLYEWNELDEAGRHLLLCIEQGRQWGSADMLAVGSVYLAHVRQAQGQAEAVPFLAEQAEQAAGGPLYSPSTTRTVQASLARLWLKAGQVEKVADFSANLDGKDDSGALRQLERTTQARLLLARGSPAAALDCLAGLPAGSDDERRGYAIETLVLRALALAACGQEAQALEALRRSLTLAAPGGYVRLFVDEGRPMRRLLAAGDFTAGEADLRRYAQKLLAAFGDAPPPQAPAPGGLVEPLSERELEVLRLIAAGLSNQEIAARLVVAASTVKTHINNIYGKLGVESRVQAANRARELGLV